MCRLLAALCVALSLASDALPIVAHALGEPPGEMCGSGGRCCCAGAAAAQDAGRPCLRRACGCGGGQDAAVPLLLRAPALLPAAVRPSLPDWDAASPFVACREPLGALREPSVPPPRRPPSA